MEMTNHISFITENGSWHNNRDYFCYLLCAAPTRNAIVEKSNNLYFTKTTWHLGGRWVVKALNLDKWGAKIYNCALKLQLPCPFSLYCPHALFSKTGPITSSYGFEKACFLWVLIAVGWFSFLDWLFQNVLY